MKVTVNILLFFLSFFGIQNGTVLAQSPEVIGGTNAMPGEFPWMAAIVLSDSTSSCGATLIRPSWVLTVAHCNLSYTTAPTLEKIIINSVVNDPSSLESFSELIDIDTLIMHPDANSPFFVGVDLALIHLSYPSSIQPISLSSFADSTYYAGEMPGKVLGWGFTNAAGPLNDSLLLGDLIFIDNDTCEYMYSFATPANPYQVNPEGHICAGFYAGTNPVGAALGDSGGPLFFENSMGEYQQVGIVSRAQNSITSADFPGLYTSIPVYLDWIENTIEAFENGTLTNAKYSNSHISMTYLANKSVEISGLDNDSEYVFQVFNVLGKKMSDDMIIKEESSKSIPLNNLTTGFYILSILDLSNNKLLTQKIVVN